MELAELKAWIHVDYDDDDNVIQMIYDAVIEEIPWKKSAISSYRSSRY